MAEEIKYYTGNCITDLHTDTSFSYCNKEKCKQYIKSDDLNFCMSSACPEKDCIYALVNKLHKMINGLEQKNKELKELNKKICEDWEKKIKVYWNTLEEINLILDELKQQYDYMTDYSEIKEVQDKINEVLNA